MVSLKFELVLQKADDRKNAWNLIPGNETCNRFQFRFRQERPDAPKKEWVSKPVLMIRIPTPARLVVSEEKGSIDT